jgi:hypothetical protein
MEQEHAPSNSKRERGDTLPPKEKEHVVSNSKQLHQKYKYEEEDDGVFEDSPPSPKRRCSGVDGHLKLESSQLVQNAPRGSIEAADGDIVMADVAVRRVLGEAAAVQPSSIAMEREISGVTKRVGFGYTPISLDDEVSASPLRVSVSKTQQPVEGVLRWNGDKLCCLVWHARRVHWKDVAAMKLQYEEWKAQFPVRWETEEEFPPKELEGTDL